MSNTLLELLNSEQVAAVTAAPGHLLILAGAGSGKTRVLTHRIAWLLTTGHAHANGILAVTFTNKAAHEMRHRLQQVAPYDVRHLWIGTFHSIAHRLLRLHWQAAGLSENFQIIDSDDQYRLVRRVLAQLNLDEKNWPPRQAQWFINSQKELGLRAAQVDDEHDAFRRTQIRIYSAYEELCAATNSVDFAELLLRVHELWRNSPDILAHYQARFSHLLVDEFQDTNAMQYAWIRQLAGANTDVMVVGDDDQAIYGWRGALAENLAQFLKDYANVTTICLEQNYRSTKTILHAANAVIAKNDDRLGKELWTEGEEGEPISLYEAFDEHDEARFIRSCIQKAYSQGVAYSAMAILYRSNAQSRVLEETLLEGHISYRIYGGLRFFDRAEVKDALAYLRLVYNVDDDTAFERIVNQPPRGIGDKTMEQLRDAARGNALSLWQAARKLITEGALANRAATAINGFIELILALQPIVQQTQIDSMLEQILQRSELSAYYKKDRSEKGLAKSENLDELITVAKEFSPEANTDLPPLAAFLAQAVLDSGEKEAAMGEDAVQMMTLHSAKGLEFPIVFMCGLEEGLFPHYLSVNDGDGLAEERRLCYVGMTRAMKKLYLTYAQSRQLHGRSECKKHSRFLSEIPKEYIKKERLSSSFTPLRATSGYGFNLGERVRHPLFGEGTILAFEGSGDHARVQVQFVNFEHGTKWLVCSFAKLQKV